MSFSQENLSQEVVDSWQEYMAHLENNNIFECIENKNVLEIGTANGLFWETYNLYNPSSITGLDPDTRWDLTSGLDEKDMIRESYDTYLPKTGYDVIICFGFIYKLHSPIHLLELMARSRPEYIILEDLDNEELVCGPLVTNYAGGVGELVVSDEVYCPYVTKLPMNTIISAMESMSYRLENSYKMETEHSAKRKTIQCVFRG